MKQRILFVDDEPKILKGLQRMLRSMRHEWDMHFCTGGEEALEVLVKERFDVIVSDMRMPALSGAALLGKVRKLQPGIVRFILSGHANLELTMESVGSAHQFLAKPCRPDDLKRRLQSVSTLRRFLKDDVIRAVISDINVVPSYYRHHEQIVSALDPESFCLERIRDVVSRDVGMSAKILQLVCSPFFGFTRFVPVPAEAVNLLGRDIVRQLDAVNGVFRETLGEKTSRVIRDVYTHSLACAQFAKRIAQEEKNSNEVVNTCYTAGLLHDLGKLLLAWKFADEYEEARDMAAAENCALHDAELQILGTTHGRLGAYLLGLWGLPHSVLEAVAFHNNPKEGSATEFSPLAAVHVANALAHEQCAGESSPDHRINYDYLSRLGVRDRVEVWSRVCRSLHEQEPIGV